MRFGGSDNPVVDAPFTAKPRTRKTMPTQIKIALPLLIALALVAACATSPTGRSQMILRSDSELAAEAARQFAEMRASIPLETDRDKLEISFS